MSKNRSKKQSVANIVNNLKDLRLAEQETVKLEIFHDGSFIVQKCNEDDGGEYEILSIGDEIQELAELAIR